MAKLTRKFITDTMNDIRRRTAGKDVKWDLPVNYVDFVLSRANPHAPKLTQEVRGILLDISVVTTEGGLRASGREVYQLLKDAVKFNKKLKKLPANQKAVLPVYISSIRSLEGLKRVSERSPQELFDRKIQNAKIYLRKSLEKASVPERVVDVVMAHVDGMPDADFHDFASSFGAFADFYNGIFIVRPRLLELIKELGIDPDAAGVGDDVRTYTGLQNFSIKG